MTATDLPAAEKLAMQIPATLIFTLAVIHTFFVKFFNQLSHRFRQGSIGENLCHFLGEIEIVFGLWASVLVALWSVKFGTDSAIHYLESVNFTEPAFVFVIMAMAATKPVIDLARRMIFGVARLIPFNPTICIFSSILIIGPLLGSLITEPAAMTISALLLKDLLSSGPLSTRSKYLILAALFVNVSIGGTLTHYAAPPVVMVAGPWNWDTAFMFTHFGDKAALSILLSVILLLICCRKDLSNLKYETKETSAVLSNQENSPLWIALLHLGFMTLTVLHSHHMAFFLPLFLLFLGWLSVSQEHQFKIDLRQALLVGYFLGGLVTLGSLQSWWLSPLVSKMSDNTLFWGATALTGITDNAALTFLGTLVPNLSDSSKYMLVAGAVTGGGLTVIANAPNPIGYSLLLPFFGEDGINPFSLLLAAIPFTLIAAGAFLLL